jgi:hypothetical protein
MQLRKNQKSDFANRSPPPFVLGYDDFEMLDEMPQMLRRAVSDDGTREDIAFSRYRAWRQATEELEVSEHRAEADDAGKMIIALSET